MCVLYGSESVVTLRNGIDVCEEGRGTEGVKSAPDNTFDFLVRPSGLVQDVGLTS
jgi:hypothetical protein